MKHRDTSFSLIFVAVILAHVGFIGWLVFGNNGCQHDLAASESAALTPEDKPPIQLNFRCLIALSLNPSSTRL